MEREGKVMRVDFGKAYSADGSSTLDSLKTERARLEARLKKIPVDLSNLNNGIRLRTEDINWLKSLSNSKRKRWEKEKETTAKEAIYKAEQTIISYKARVASVQAEQKRIPSQISTITSQITTLIKGESTGLEKGLDKETARELGEIELQKEQERLAHERSLQELQLEKERNAALSETQSGQNQTKWLIGIGAVLLLGIIAWVIYKRKFAVKIASA